MAHILIVFAPDEDLPDPTDPQHTAVSRGHVILPEHDALVIWREYGDQFKGGLRTHVVGSGVYENVGAKQVEKAMRKLAGLGR